MRNIIEGQSSSPTTKKIESRSISFYFVDWTYIPWDFIRNVRTEHLAHQIFKMFVKENAIPKTSYRYISYFMSQLSLKKECPKE